MHLSFLPKQALIILFKLNPPMQRAPEAPSNSLISHENQPEAHPCRKCASANIPKREAESLVGQVSSEKSVEVIPGTRSNRGPPSPLSAPLTCCLRRGRLFGSRATCPRVSRIVEGADDVRWIGGVLVTAPLLCEIQYSNQNPRGQGGAGVV